MEEILLGGGDDDDIEYAILDNVLIDQEEIDEGPLFNLNNLTNEQIINNFRFLREDLLRLKNVLNIQDTIKTENGNRVDGIDIFEKMKDLYITDSLHKLDILCTSKDVISSLKKNQRFTHFAKLLKTQLLQCQDDQELCYVLCMRYIALMDYLFLVSDDKTYTKSLHLSDYRKVKLLADELKTSLEQRYSLLSKESELTSPPTLLIPKTNKMETGDSLVYKDKFILPQDLYQILQSEKNFLLVDIRPRSEYEKCCIIAKKGTVINIPADLIVPGLSANTLGKRLDDSLKEVWEKRDKFDIIILMDNDTQKYNYVGSKVERLRSFIVEWDTCRNYKHEPVVLNGGLREFVDWYPTKVDNSQVFVSQKNFEIDELLDLDSITYPESGSTKQMNLKIHDLDSITNLDNGIKDDIKNENKEDKNNLHSLSEGHLPLDFQGPKENDSTSPFKSASEDSVRKPLVSPETPSLYEDQSIKKPKLDINEIKEILEDDKAALLREARMAMKPKFNAGEPQDIGDTKVRDEIKDTSLKGGKEPGFDLMPSKPKVPTVDRSFKPISLIGEGYTGLKNIKNICYMNALLQCLKVIPILKSVYVTTDKYIHFTTRNPPKLNYHFARVLRELWAGTYQKPRVYMIQEFKDRLTEFAPMYDRGSHEDCFEFFMFLFNALSEDCSSDMPRVKIMTESEKAWYGHLQGRSSFLVDNFYYQLKNTKICFNCKKVNLSFETDSSLMLPVSTKSENLRDMIKEYLKENILSDFSCSKCKSTGIINKKELVEEPEVLVIVLKRYIANPDGTFRKNEVEVDFPLYDLQFGKSRYNLYGVVQHTGGMTFGHYFASVLLNDKKDTWVLFNDESISVHSSPVNEQMQIKTGAAGFFYVRNKYSSMRYM